MFTIIMLQAMVLLMKMLVVMPVMHMVGTTLEMDVADGIHLKFH